MRGISCRCVRLLHASLQREGDFMGVYAPGLCYGVWVPVVSIRRGRLTGAVCEARAPVYQLRGRREAGVPQGAGIARRYCG